LAIKADGSLWAWGANGRGELGNGSTERRLLPTRVGADNNWRTLAIGGIFTASSFATKSDGTLWAWGANSVDFQFPGAGADYLGIGDLANVLSPVRLGQENDWQAVFSNFDRKLALKTDGSLWTWAGFRDTGAFFTPADFLSSSPAVENTDLINVESFIARVVQHSDRISAFAWETLGFAFFPEAQQRLADPAVPLAERGDLLRGLLNHLMSGGPSIYEPQRFAGVTLSPEINALLARNPEGFDLQRLNRLLLEAAYPNELLPFSRHGFSAISIGSGHWLGVRKDGSLWAMGDNSRGQLGSPTGGRVGTDLDWKRVAAGQQVSAAIKQNGTLWTWGNYADGLLGDPTLLMPRLIGNSAAWSSR
jgi:hypothetical protein